jgi:hypothetical protein
MNLILRTYLIDRYNLDYSINVTIIFLCCEKIQLSKRVSILTPKFFMRSTPGHSQTFLVWSIVVESNEDKPSLVNLN